MNGPSTNKGSIPALALVAVMAAAGRGQRVLAGRNHWYARVHVGTSTVKLRVVALRPAIVALVSSAMLVVGFGQGTAQADVSAVSGSAHGGARSPRLPDLVIRSGSVELVGDVLSGSVKVSNEGRAGAKMSKPRSPGALEPDKLCARSARSESPGSRRAPGAPPVFGPGSRAARRLAATRSSSAPTRAPSCANAASATTAGGSAG